MRTLSFLGIFLLDSLFYLFKVLLSEIYVSDRIYWGAPLSALLFSFLFIFSAEVIQSFWGVLGIAALGIYGAVVLTIRIKNLNRY